MRRSCRSSAAGAGAGLLPRPLAEIAAYPRLRRRRAATPRSSRAVALVHRDGILTPAAQRFVRLAAGQN